MLATSLSALHTLQILPVLSQGPLAFVAMRLALDELASATSEGVAELPPIVSRKLYEVVAVVAMQFRGYIFKVNEPQVRCETMTEKFFGAFRKVKTESKDSKQEKVEAVTI